MRHLLTILMLIPAALTLAAAPAVPTSPVVGKLIDQLGSDDEDTRKAAEKKLEGLGEDVLPVLHQAAKKHADIDVRLRALVLARAIRGKHWGLIKAIGPGAEVNQVGAHGYWLNRVRFSRDGKHAIAAGGALILFEIATGKEVGRVLEVGGARPGLDLSKDGKHVLTGHANSPDFHLVELPSLKTVQTFKGKKGGGVPVVALSPDGATALASHSADSTIHVWDVKTGKDLGQLKDGLVSYAPSLSFSPDGKKLLIAQYGKPGDEFVRLYDVSTRKPIKGFKGHKGSVTCVKFRPDGKTGVSSDQDGELILWDLETGKAVRRMEHGSHVNDIAVSPDGKRLLSGGFEDRKVKLWDLETGKLIESFEGHVSRVLGVAFSADGKQAISSDAVCCVRVWKLGK
jgi:WD40 repeat protein